MSFNNNNITNMMINKYHPWMNYDQFLNVFRMNESEKLFCFLPAAQLIEKTPRQLNCLEKSCSCKHLLSGLKLNGA